jgi:hypothetical protein
MTEATPIQSVTTAHPLRVAVDAYERPQVGTQGGNRPAFYRKVMGFPLELDPSILKLDAISRIHFPSSEGASLRATPVILNPFDRCI